MDDNWSFLVITVMTTQSLEEEERKKKKALTKAQKEKDSSDHLEKVVNAHLMS